MTRLFFLVATLLTIFSINTRPMAIETMRPDELKRGMKGYGLSVFSGTQPERFNVEIVEVIKNAMPKQDMILIRVSGKNLEQYKSVSGMSGSPIYINDKLIGAYAYGWGLQNEPIAGVTPIHNMLAGLATKIGPAKPAQQGMLPVPWQPVAGVMRSVSDPNDLMTPRQMLTPLALSGFSAPVVEMFRKELEQMGLLPVAAAGGATPGKLPRGKVEAGSCIGIQIVSGDVNGTAIGTATYVDGDRVVAFGHPFTGGGSTSAPAVLAEVKHIMSSMMNSFKMAQPVAEIGSLIGDWQAGVVLDTAVTASTIPMTINVVNHDTGQREKYDLQLINNPFFSSFAARIALAQCISAATGSSDDTTIKIVTRLQVGDREVRFENLIFNDAGGVLSMDMFSQVAQPFQSPFGFPEVKKIEVQAEAWLTRRTAEIKRAYFTQPTLRRGEKATLRVVLKPFNQPEIVRDVDVEVPLDYAEPTLAVFVMAGGRVSIEAAPPETLGDYLDALERKPRNTDLIVITPRPTPAVKYQGKILRDLPVSMMNTLAGQSMGMLSRDLRRTAITTEWVLSGSTGVVVPIKKE